MKKPESRNYNPCVMVFQIRQNIKPVTQHLTLLLSTSHKLLNIQLRQWQHPTPILNIKLYSGSGRGVLILFSRPFFTRIPHPVRFSSVSRIPLLFPRKIHFISTKAKKCKMWVDPFDWYFEFTRVFKGFCKKK